MLWPIGSGDAFKGVLDRRSGTVALFERGDANGAARERLELAPLELSRAELEEALAPTLLRVLRPLRLVALAAEVSLDGERMDDDAIFGEDLDYDDDGDGGGRAAAEAAKAATAPASPRAQKKQQARGCWRTRTSARVCSRTTPTLDL